ncbi:MAG: PDZ domain-containing protein [Gammaproteobacteria bacterium]|nr:PDZ domain-containing protein [Gammaproteobacteria bacterium]
MKATHLAMALATTFSATAFVHAADESDNGVIEATKVEDVETAQAEMHAARAQMEAARIELQDAARRLAEASRQRLTFSGKMNRAFLGVLIGEQSEDGIVVAGVTPAGGAETAGIEADDIIVAIDGESLTGRDQPLHVLHGVLDDVSAGAEVEVTVLRDGNTETYEVATTPSVIHIEGQAPGLLRRLGQAFEGHVPFTLTPAAPVAPARPWPGLTGYVGVTGQLHLVDIGEDLGDYFGVDGGVLVLNAPGKSELKPGDILRRIDGADVGSADEAYRLLATASGDDAELEVRRKNRKVDATVAKGSSWSHHQIFAMPKGKATIIVDGPEVEVDVEVEKDAD